MLHQQPPLDRAALYASEGVEPSTFAAQPSGFGFDELIGVLRRRARLALGIMAAIVLLTMTYVVFETPRFASSAVIVLDSRKARPNEEIAGLSTSGADSATADSQVEVLKSESVASAVLDALKLDADPTFMEPKTLVKRFTAFLSRSLRAVTGRSGADTDRRAAALDQLKDFLTVTRVGTTYAIEVTYSFPDAKRAAEIANAFVDAYQGRQFEAKDEQARRTTSWLNTRLEELRQKSLAADFEIQRLRQEGATGGAGGTGNRTLVLLRDLERESETYKRLYQTFLARYQQAIEQESLPVDEARVVTRARAAADPIYPRKAVFLAASLFLGAGLGLAGALALEMFERSIRTARDVRERLGLPFLGMLPRMEEIESPDQRDGAYSYSLRAPGSIYTEVLKSLWVAVDTAPPHRRPKVVGVFSILPSEGKSVVSSNFALALASPERPVVLVDGDLRNPTLTKAFASRPGDGTPGADLSETKDAMMISPGLALVFAKHDEDGLGRSNLALPRSLASVVERAPTSCQCIVVDLPPLGILADVPAVAPLVDCFVLIVEWGRTPHTAIRAALENNPEVYGKCLGVLINRVDFDKLKLYDRGSSSEPVRRMQQTYFKGSGKAASAA